MAGLMTPGAFGPEFYDRAMGRGSLARKSLKDSPWRPLYAAAVWYVTVEDRVIDLGCGTGRFAKALAERGVRDYLGLDFAPKVIEEARRYVKAPGFEFAVHDLRDGVVQEPDALYACLEVLEHLEDDLGLIRSLPDQARLLFSVPSYDSESHLRFFSNPLAAFERYAQVVALEQWERVLLTKERHFSLFLGRVERGAS